MIKNVWNLATKVISGMRIVTGKEKSGLHEGGGKMKRFKDRYQKD